MSRYPADSRKEGTCFLYLHLRFARRERPQPWRIRWFAQPRSRHETPTGPALFRSQAHCVLACHTTSSMTRLEIVCNESKEYESRPLVKRGNTKRIPG